MVLFYTIMIYVFSYLLSTTESQTQYNICKRIFIAANIHISLFQIIYSTNYLLLQIHIYFISM